ncbi:UDP-4-amino-4,6-dideoxy-N-acetyl-beta-L-altrosamine N-acetyltransferase [Pseudomonas protegens]|uniref:UDP-4-amino-4, 6-dideoxy-N-acetyl-beta-L-altrosamine N-acetyltransferase n=1 Tax=Pseudomonas protegens TaxID=380021 RepID=UPI000442525D|nr:UDP-4-amino-4,6-dideoxy-N-acetyl-beta-L-altrosamine N-acetyltransferase [Pseudomonas protegens]MCD9570418.1 UDP-4-amino-4,6-dideoxy-N-acetyl-beta-L-altrosamine N-acetyltransferase [Pseudomonas protegens]BAO63248.1 pseudaminic acid biosynthesis N-acetyl transferase [Pseudomonas protegens Cab57]
MQLIPLLASSPTVQAQVRALRNQQEVRKYMYTSHEISEQEHANWLSGLQGNRRQEVFVAVDAGQALGVVSLNAINALQKTADWAFYLDAELQGKGLGSLMEFWLLDYAFNQAALDKLNCEVLASNTAVIRLHLKFGFVQEGLRRQNILKDGERIDVVLLGITRQEWQDKRPALEGLIARLGQRES